MTPDSPPPGSRADVVARLIDLARHEPPVVPSYVPELAHLERLLIHNLESENARLREQAERLREALKPFARVGAMAPSRADRPADAFYGAVRNSAWRAATDAFSTTAPDKQKNKADGN